MEINSKFNSIEPPDGQINNPHSRNEKKLSGINQKTDEIAQQTLLETISSLESINLTDEQLITKKDHSYIYQASPPPSQFFSLDKLPFSKQQQPIGSTAEIKLLERNVNYVTVESTSLGITPPSLAFSDVKLEDGLRWESFSVEYWDSPDYQFKVKIGEHTYDLHGMGLDGNRIAGRGCFGRVFLGTDETGKKVAVKVAKVLDEHLDNLKKEGQFLLEMQGRDHVMSAEACGFLNEKLFIVMNPMNGGDLIDLIITNSLSSRDKIQILIDSAKGIKECHDAGILHRDIKPENIMAERIKQPDGSDQYKARVIDLGLAVKIEKNSKEIVGTPEYLAPELIVKREQTPACDVFSFGQVIYSTITGQLASITDLRCVYWPNPVRNPWRNPWGNIGVDQKILMNAGLSQAVAGQYKALIDDCLKWNYKERPSIEDVISRLDTILEQIA